MPQTEALLEVKINHPPQLLPDTKPNLQQLLTWRDEAMVAQDDWRKESWRDCEMVDGDQWTDTDKAKAIDAGIPYTLTINRTFPTVNLLIGLQIINKYDIIAKGRTSKDSEISQVMTEGVKYVMDQNDGLFRVSQAFKDEIVPGVGFLATGFNSDPRKEKVKVDYRDWKTMWFDPYASPWIEPERCRYVIYQPWMDIIDLQALFPEKRKEIDEQYNNLSRNVLSNSASVYDQATEVEEKVLYSVGSGWVVNQRKRVRPAEVWYTHYETCIFVIFPDGNVLEVRPELPPLEQFDMVRYAQEVVKANVKKIRAATILGDLILADVKSPYAHDQFPFVPFVGYVDRYNRPYGVPRQLRDQEEEINRRRSMALALLNSRRVTMEEDAPGETQTIDELYEEANKPDGFLVVSPGAIKNQKILIHDQAQLTPMQMQLLEQSEREVDQIAGMNAEIYGRKSNAISGVAEEKRVAQSATVTMSLFENLRRSLNILGYQTVCNIKGAWTGEKVLRITDRMSGADRFVELNKRIPGANGSILIQNNVTQSKVDIVVSDAPMTDTTRELNMMMIIEWIKKSPPEIIPQLLMLAFEMSNMPNKDQLLARIKPLLGLDPRDEDLSPEQLKQKAIQGRDAQAQKQAVIEQLQLEAAKLKVQGSELENKRLMAEIQKIVASITSDLGKTKAIQDKVGVSRDRLQLDGMKQGFDFQDKINKADMERVQQAFDMEETAKMNDHTIKTTTNMPEETTT
jgi:hypothetical protein